VIVHWDDVERERYEWEPDTAAWWTNLGGAAGTVQVGLKRMDVDRGKLSVPVHVHSREEEITFVLGGSGSVWQGDKRYAIRTGDCIVHLADREAHSLVGGDDGLAVLVFGTRDRSDVSYLPRTGRGHIGGFWFDITWGDRPPEQPGDLPPAADERPPNIVNVDELEPEVWEHRDMGNVERHLAAAAGSVRTGLNHETVPAGKLNTTPHCHSAEEEIFVLLDGEGTLLLGDEEQAVRAGHVVSRPPGTRKAHAFRAGDGGLTMLSYGTREPNDITYYPRSRVFALRGVGVIGRLDPIDPEADLW
jgi:uncharacterized cupin superfamily protein